MKNLKQRLMQISEELRQLAESEVFLPTSAVPVLPQT